MRLKTMEKKVRQLQNKLASIPEAKTLVMKDKAKPRDTFVFNRGDFTDPSKQVEPGTPIVLGGRNDGPANRLMLAQWLVSQDNPLTARVFVNRVWFEIFGQGIVTTLEDFGVKGERPTHPELLGSLAVEFMEEIRLEKYCKDTEYECVQSEEVEEEGDERGRRRGCTWGLRSRETRA